jgi:ribosomal protein S6--L-glutamate ligase
MNLYFMLALRTRVAPNPVLVETFDLLRRRGFDIALGIAEELLLQLDGPGLTHDLYVLKSHTALWLSLAEIVHTHGGRLLNPFPACLAAQNKIVAVERMRTAGIPTPRSWVTGDPEQLRSIVADCPVILKPYAGGRGLGIRVVHSPHELAKAPRPQEPVLIQEYIPHDDELKVYVIGEDVFALRTRPESRDAPRWPSPLRRDVREIALRCGRLFDLHLYGLDIVESAAGPLVVDLNYFPSYRDVPQAAVRMADFIDAYARGPAAARVPVQLRRIARAVGAAPQ